MFHVANLDCIGARRDARVAPWRGSIAGSLAEPADQVRGAPASVAGRRYYLSRLLAERLQPVLGHPSWSKNKPGAGGNIAREFVAKAPADGYTILMSESSHVMAAGIWRQDFPYDPIKDFEPVSLAATIPFRIDRELGDAGAFSEGVHRVRESIATAC